MILRDSTSKDLVAWYIMEAAKDFEPLYSPTRLRATVFFGEPLEFFCVRWDGLQNIVFTIKFFVKFEEIKGS